MRAADRDPPCFTVRHDDSSGNVTETHAGCMCSSRATESGSNEQPPASMNPDDALRFAIKVALDAGDYDRASALLEILKCTPLPKA
jgi:hypothetical protein